jgi:bla regulator protein blaR1
MMTMPFSGIAGIQTIAPYIAESWIASLWQGMTLALGVWFCLKMLPRISASTRFVIWIITFLTIVSLPVLRLASMILATGHSSVVQTTVPATHSFVQLSPSWALAITAVWFLAVLFQAVRLLLDLWKLRTIHNTSSPVDVQKLNPELHAILRNTTKRRVQLRISETMDTPSAVGFFKPAVVIPRWLWEEFSPTQLKQVLVHELAHLRRYDDWTNLLQKLVRALLPVNPALYWVERHLCFERELACDDAVLGAQVTARDYATCLTTLAEKKFEQRATVLAPGAIEKQSDLARRVYSLLSRTRNSSLLVARGVTAGFLFATLSGAVAFTQCPQWVSFASPEPAEAPAIRAAVLPASELHLATMRVNSSSQRESHLLKTQPAVLTHTSVRKNTPVMTVANLPAEQKTSAMPDQQGNGQVLIVLSVWQETADLRVSRTALIFTGSNAPSAESAKSDNQVRQGWFILQI